MQHCYKYMKNKKYLFLSLIFILVLINNGFAQMKKKRRGRTELKGITTIEVI